MSAAQKKKKVVKPKKKTLLRESDVERIYQKYPRHVGRKKAIDAIDKALRAIGDRNNQPDPAAWLLNRVQAFAKSLRIALVLKAGHKIVGKTKIIGFTTALPAHPPAEPKVQHIVQVNIRQQW